MLSFLFMFPSFSNLRALLREQYTRFPIRVKNHFELRGIFIGFFCCCRDLVRVAKSANS